MTKEFDQQILRRHDHDEPCSMAVNDGAACAELAR